MFFDCEHHYGQFKCSRVAPSDFFIEIFLFLTPPYIFPFVNFRKSSQKKLLQMQLIDFRIVFKIENVLEVLIANLFHWKRIFVLRINHW